MADDPTADDAGARVGSGAIRSLGLAMIGLGIARGWPAGVALARFLQHHAKLLIHTPSAVPWEDFSGLVLAAWPVIFGVALVRSGSSRLVKAAAISTWALGLERVVALIVGGVFDSGWRELYRGSWDPSLGSVLPRGMALAGLILSAVGWVILGIWSWRMALAIRARDLVAAPPPVRGRRGRPRYINIAAVVFTFGLVCISGWGTYLTVLERLPWVRNLIITSERDNRVSQFVLADTPQGRRFREADRYFGEGQGFQGAGRFTQARQSYIKAVNRYEDLVDEFPKVRAYRRQFVLAANNLAWFLVTCPEKSVRDPDTAVLLARKVVAINPDDGNSLNTLAVAQFRAADFDGARLSFEKSMEKRDGGDAFDWFFLAQIETTQGRDQLARDWYEKASSWTAEYRPSDPELHRFHVEAADRLGLPKPAEMAAKPASPPSRQGAAIFDPKPRRRPGS